MKCPNCGETKQLSKYGLRETNKGPIQKYYCNGCNSYFSSSKRPYTQYPEHVILYTLEQYNRGYPVKQAKTRTGKKYHYSPPIRTIYSWINRYKDTMTFLKLRKKYDVHPETVTTTHRLQHQQVYPFSYHSLKMHFSAKQFPQLRRYISWIERSLPDKIFLKGPRASSTKIDNPLQPKKKMNLAPELTRLSLHTKTRSESTHEAVERFFLLNDSKTICTELPVFLNPEELRSSDSQIGESDRPQEIDLLSLDIDTPLTGHIDMIQVRSNKIYIMDYKRNLRHPENHTSQLFLYREALHNRLSVPRKRIVPAVFNEYGYYELI